MHFIARFYPNVLAGPITIKTTAAFSCWLLGERPRETNQGLVEASAGEGKTVGEGGRRREVEPKVFSEG